LKLGPRALMSLPSSKSSSLPIGGYARQAAARLTFLQKGGVLGVSPGKGRALAYTPDLIHRLIFSVELAEIGVTPAATLGTIEDLWEKRVRPPFTRAEKAAMAAPGPEDIILQLGGVSLMVGGWTSVAMAVPNVNACELRKLPDNMLTWMRTENDPPWVPRVLVINLSDRLRRFHAALAATAEPEQPQTGKTEARGRRKKMSAGKQPPHGKIRKRVKG
jgi:hypothetical protein